MIAASSDLEKESRKQLAESLFSRLRQGLAAMRLDLETERMPEARQARDALAPLLGELAGLLGRAALAKARARDGSDPDGPDSLQTFRRAALADLEGLEEAYRKLSAGAWHSGADEAREARVRGSSLRWGAALGLGAVLLAGWWGWQWTRQRTSEREIERARIATAAQAVRLISATAWLAQRTQGKPLGDMARDMSAECANIDVRATFPNHPCREAWTANGHAVFKGAIPAPAAPVDTPSEIYSDPWGSPYILLLPEGGTPRIVSPGPDGKLGTPDDIGVDIPSWGRPPGEGGGTGQ